MSCSPFFFAGLGECKAFRERVKGVLVTAKGTVVTLDNAKLLATWEAMLAPSDGKPTAIYIPFDRGYQNNTSEPEITTSNLGYSEKTQEFPPMIKGFGDMSYADFKGFFAADGQVFDIWLVLKDGTLEGTYTSAGYKGYRGKFFMTANAPNADNLQESFPFDISFSDVIEWKANSTPVAASFSPTELQDAVPAGLDVAIISAYTAGDVTVMVTKRNQSSVPYAGLDAVSDWNVLFTEGDSDVAVTAVDAAGAAQGIYILTIQKDSSGTPGDLTKPVTIQGFDVDGGSVTLYMTNALRIEV